jgi:hypothetical protein
MRNVELGMWSEECGMCYSNRTKEPYFYLNIGYEF